MDLPHDDALRWLVTEYARLRHAHGEIIGTPELIEPTGRHFPDAFQPDGQSVARLLTRMMSYAPLSEDIDVGLRFLEEEGEGGGGGCGSGSCGTGAAPALKDRVIAAGDAYIVEMPASDVAHPALLTTTLARSVGTIVLTEAEDDVDPADRSAVSEVAASVCGFGVLLTSGAHVYGKSCGGVRMHQHTHLTVSEHAVLLAIFCALHGLKASSARAHLDPTQREAFAEAQAWVDSNPALVKELESRPEILADGVFEISPVKGLLGRFFARPARDAGPEALAVAIPAKRKVRTEEEERRLAEAKALVEQALGE